MDKRQMRENARAILNQEDGVHDADIIRRAEEIMHDMQGPVFVYVSVGREIGTRELIRSLLERGCRVCVPKVEGRGIMKAVEISSMSELAPGTWGIPEPPDRPGIDPEIIQACIVPCLMCSREGSRLGQGGGYYDRYLEDFDGKTIGLCREDFFQINLPREPFDAWVRCICSVKGGFMRWFSRYTLATVLPKCKNKHERRCAMEIEFYFYFKLRRKPKAKKVTLVIEDES